MASDPVLELDSSRHTYLQQLWREQLKVPQITVDADFFEAGGSSMQVIEMLMIVSSTIGRDIDYAEFFKEPSIRKLSQLLGDR